MQGILLGKLAWLCDVHRHRAASLSGRDVLGKNFERYHLGTASRTLWIITPRQGYGAQAGCIVRPARRTFSVVLKVAKLTVLGEHLVGCAARYVHPVTVQQANWIGGNQYSVEI
jgi:hypothetical protein